jgi:hypothetical protein
MLESHRDELPRDVAGLMDRRGRVLEVIENWLDEAHAGAEVAAGSPSGAPDG